MNVFSAVFSFSLCLACFHVSAQQDSIPLLLKDTIAYFPGGRAAFNEYLKENLHYPQEAMDLGIQGKCYVSFTVEANGSITEVHVKRGIPKCPECDKEAIRLVSGMPNWIPATQNGKLVSSKQTMGLTFKIK